MNGTLMDARLLDDLVEGGGGVLAGRPRYPWARDRSGLDDLVEGGGGVLADCILNIQHADTQSTDTEGISPTLTS